jgi:hypothetical protein
MNWQPIATAPTNQRVLVFTIDEVEVGELRLNWRGHDSVWIGDNWDSYGEPMILQPQPTLWMPLPDDPPQ